jgi:hypothetical protein
MGRWVCTEKWLQMRGIMAEEAKRGSQWDRWKIRVLGRVDGSMEKKAYKC